MTLNKVFDFCTKFPNFSVRRSWSVAFPRAVAQEAIGRGRAAAYAAYLDAELLRFWGGWQERSSGGSSPWPSVRVVARLREVLPAARTFVDVGAAAYEGPDECFACLFARLWGCDRLLVAVEPDGAALRATRDRYPDVSPCVRWHAVALSNATGAAELRGAKPNTATLQPLVSGTVDEYAGDDARAVSTWTLVDFAERYYPGKLEEVDVLKIDAEGHDWAVLQGAESFLRRGAIKAIFFELSNAMNEDFFRIHRLGGRSERLHSAREPTLRSLVRWLDELAYDTYLVGPVLIPLWGAWWRDEYEVCLRPAPVCWYDVLAVSRAAEGLAHALTAAFPL